MKQSIFAIACLMLLPSCLNKRSGQPSGTALVQVGNKILTREDIERQIPKNTSPTDSALLAESFEKRWAIDALMDEEAYENIGDEKAEIDKLVETYRLSLLRHRYQEKMIRDKVSSQISESDIQAYYEENKQQFVLSENLVKGLFLKIPANAPGIADIRKWYTSESEDALEKIEKYSIQNAIIYDYFYDRWVNFSEIMDKMPQKLSNPAQFLRVNKHLEVSDSTHYFFLNISDRLLIGDMAPIDYVNAQIQEILVNQRKVNYMREFEENLYQDAIKKGKVKFLTKE